MEIDGLYVEKGKLQKHMSWEFFRIFRACRAAAASHQAQGASKRDSLKVKRRANQLRARVPLQRTQALLC